MSLDLEIRERLYQLLDGRLALDEFKEWFVPAMWDSRDPEAAGLANHVKLLLAEFSSGHRTLSELQRELEVAASMYEVDQRLDRPPLAGSNAETVVTGVSIAAGQGQPAGTGSELVLA